MGAQLKGATWRGSEPTRSTAELIAYAAAKQTQVRAGGCIISGMPVETTELGLSLLNGAVSRAMADPSAVTNWVVNATTTVSLNASQITALGVAVANWVQSTFDALSAAYAAINADPPTITTLAGIEAASWPSNT